MKAFRKNARAVFAVVLALFALLCGYFVYALRTYGTRWQTNPYNVRVQNQKSAVTAGDIRDRNGVVLVTSDSEGNRVYADSRTLRKALAHVTGDNFGLTSTGAESFFANYLLGMDAGLFEMIGNAFSGGKQRGSDVVLTVDAELTKYAYGLLDGHSGAIVLMNYKTGEILVMTSSPAFDPKTADEYLPDEEGNVKEDDGALVNRVTAGQYTPGSVFKIITAAAAIRYLPNAMDMTIPCGGPLAFRKDTGAFLEEVDITPEEDQENRKNPDFVSDYLFVRDYQSSYHDELTLKQAFAKSCNVSFARLSMMLGADKIHSMAKSFGIGEDFTFSDVALYPSSYVKGASQYETAWSAVGQHKDIMTPLNLCMISAAIANDGAMMEPKLLKRVVNSANYITTSLKTSVYSTPLTKAEAELLRELMEAVVTSGTGTAAKISGYTVCGKTGTAQTGKAEDDAWFTGFVYDDDHPYAIAVIVEQGGSGGGVAAPIARKVLKKAISLG
ncbi:MAG: peptidoglycan D,D-transpeptidase FtsI family protein [Christensenellales bacterium]